VGADCDATFDSMESCIEAFQACVPDDCRKTGCEEGHYCDICWSGYACIPDGAVC
jgi:hypothetical protein